jgi:hypothetical protein
MEEPGVLRRVPVSVALWKFSRSHGLDHSVLVAMTYSPLNGILGDFRPPHGVTYVEARDGFEIVASVRRPIEAAILILVLVFMALTPKDPGALLPMLVIVPIVVSILAMMVAGNMRIRLSGGTLQIFTGIRRIGWNRRYAWDDFRTADELHIPGKGGGLYVALYGKNHVRFGKLLNEESRAFVIQVLQHHLGVAPTPAHAIAQEPPGSLPLPQGVTYSETSSGFEVSASTRSLAGAAFMTLLLAIGWVSFKDSWIAVFPIVMFGPPALMCFAGRVRITLSDGTLRIFTGLGPIGWSHNLDWNHVREVKETYDGRNGGGRVSIRGITDVEFGQYLDDANRAFFLHVLQYHLTARANGSVSS